MIKYLFALIAVPLLIITVSLVQYEMIVPAESCPMPAGKIAAEASVYLTQEPTPRVSDPFRPFLDAIMQVESGGDRQAVGDNGRSYGPYQIRLPYWKDAGGSMWTYLNHVREPDICEMMMFAYWNRYCRKALSEMDYETLARIHNGGPRGAMKESTKPYWRKVKAAMQYSKGD